MNSRCMAMNKLILKMNTESGITSAMIDRMAEGVLSPAELREAVALLDASPDGWKRLAIAFLEAQCLNEALRPMTPLPVIRRWKPWLSRTAVAATVAASFAMGWAGHGARMTAAPAAHPVVAQALPEPPAPVAQAEPVLETTPAPPVEPSPLDQVQAYLASQPPAVSDHTRYLLQQQGYEVDQERRIVTGVLPDGRVVLAPVDQVRIRQASYSPL